MQAGAIADIQSVVNNCDEALNQAEQQAGVSTKSAVIGIAGELVKGTTTTVRCNRKNPEKELDIAEVEKLSDWCNNGPVNEPSSNLPGSLVVKMLKFAW